MPRRQSRSRLTLEVIHRSLSKVESLTQNSVDNDKHSENNVTSDLKTMNAVTSLESTEFDNALHRYTTFVRPIDQGDVERLVELVVQMAVLCGSNGNDWKIFLLSAFRRRYHAKAPTAKQALKALENEESLSEAVDGDGERLVFYVTCLALHRYKNVLEESDDTVNPDHLQCLKAAIQCMISISPKLGGTRDVNAMIEHLCFELLLDLGHATLESPIPSAPSTFTGKIVPTIQEVFSLQSSLSDSALEQALQIAAGLLDSDLEKCKRKLGSDGEETSEAELCSTIHVTLPHNNRGSSKGKSWQRNMVNTVAELLIWEKTRVTQTDDRFSGALSELKRQAPSSSDGHDCVLRMQTTARKRRKLLNDHAREEGFMVSSLYLMDKSSVTLRMIRRSKAGDLDMLSKLARKNSDSNILKMILKRNLDPSKATPIESIDALVHGWVDIQSSKEKDSIDELELKLQDSIVCTTVQKLSSMVTEKKKRSTLVTLVGTSRSNAVGAVLVASALGENTRLYIGKEQSVGTHEQTMNLLNSIFLCGESSNDPLEDQASHHDIQQVLASQAKESQDVIVFSSKDIELDEAVLQSLQKKDIRIRVHSTHKIEIPGGSVQVQLHDKIYDQLKSGAPISLSVLLDCTGSMGEEIEGCKRGALKLISTFHDLSPVQHANFMGYWDPIGSRGDPEPRSTGFLEPTRKNLEKIQAFVNSKLPCTGGGDEPEDIPAALEKLTQDIKTAGLGDNGQVHFCFLIADAGYRSNEESRVTRCLEELKKMGLVMVMRPVRSTRTCQRLVAKNSAVFKPSGQYIQLNGVGQLSSIASIVTESIRASLFESSNLVSVTASVGQTLDAIGQVCRFERDADALEKVETLTSNADESTGQKVFVDKKKKFALSSRDLLFLQLSRLPSICHETVEGAFGGSSLAEKVASVIAKQLMETNVPVADLDKAGYPHDVVECVRQVLGGHGRMRSSSSTVE